MPGTAMAKRSNCTMGPWAGAGPPRDETGKISRGCLTADRYWMVTMPLPTVALTVFALLSFSSAATLISDHGAVAFAAIVSGRLKSMPPLVLLVVETRPMMIVPGVDA